MVDKSLALELASLTTEDWQKVSKLANLQSVVALACDGLEAVISAYGEVFAENRKVSAEWWSDFVIEWTGQVFFIENGYNVYAAAIADLARFYHQNDMPMLLMKGWGLSLDWPIPSHRQTGDIDIFLLGRGGEADQLIKDELGVEPKLNEDKHSTFLFQGYSVENHACFINDTVQPSLKALEKFFEDDAVNAIPTKVNDVEVLLPSVATNALFLPQHCGNHFVHGEASIRQLCDWACFVRSHGKEVDWVATKRMAHQAGFYRFLCCLNGIVQDHLGIHADCLPDWPRNKKLEERVLDEILAQKKPIRLSLAGKVHRYFASAWKYRLVYNSSMLISSFRLAKSYLRLHNPNAKSIWEKKK